MKKAILVWDNDDMEPVAIFTTKAKYNIWKKKQLKDLVGDDVAETDRSTIYI